MMTYKEFKRQVFIIYNEPFLGMDNNPIDYGIQRAQFEEKKLLRLIALAEQTAFSTAQRKVAGWRRQLERVQQIKVRLESRKKESGLNPPVPAPQHPVRRGSVLPFVEAPRRPSVSAR